MRGARQPSLSRRELAEEERRRKKAERDEIRQSRSFQQQGSRRSRQGTGSSIDSRSPTRQSYDMEHYNQQQQQQHYQQQQHHQPYQQQQLQQQFQQGQYPQQQHLHQQQLQQQLQQQFQQQQQQQQPTGHLQYSQSMPSHMQGGPPINMTGQLQRVPSIIDNLPPQQYQLPPQQHQAPAQSKGGFFSKVKNALSISKTSASGTARSQSMQQSSHPASDQRPPSFQSGGPSTHDGRQPSSNDNMGPEPSAHAGMAAVTAPGAQPSTYPPQTSQARDMQIRVLEAQVQELDEVKRRLAQEQQSSDEWKEKWNYQNFKLNLTIDMLVLRALELEPAGAGAGAGSRAHLSLPSAAATASAQAAGRQVTAQPWASGSGLSSQDGSGARVIKKAPPAPTTHEEIDDSMEDWNS